MTEDVVQQQIRGGDAPARPVGRHRGDDAVRAQHDQPAAGAARGGAIEQFIDRGLAAQHAVDAAIAAAAGDDAMTPAQEKKLDELVTMLGAHTTLVGRLVDAVASGRARRGDGPGPTVPPTPVIR